MVDRPLIQYNGFRRHRAFIELNAKVLHVIVFFFTPSIRVGFIQESYYHATNYHHLHETVDDFPRTG